MKFRKPLPTGYAAVSVMHDAGWSYQEYLATPPDIVARWRIYANVVIAIKTDTAWNPEG